MHAANPNRTAEEIVAAIEQLDLGPIMFKLMDPEEGQGWSREKVERMALEYRRYLILLAKYPEHTIAPTKDIDKFWHGHILDTMKYTSDCETTFGSYVHHFPYFGMRGEEDAKRLAVAADEMSALYAREFGEPLAHSSAFCIKSDAPMKDAAFCIKSDAPTKDAAFCIKSDSPATRAAFCIKSDSPVASAAFCIKSDSPATRAAFCIKSDAAAVDAAFCIKSDAPTANSAFCIKSDAPAESAAFCIKESINARSNPDVTTRPTLSA